jgi:6-hydroxycyclohex-1-ene-1-carbonyl-CoA dehydrogenase
MSERYSWRLVEAGRPLQRHPGAGSQPGPGEALVEVAGCGICHTDIGFLDGSVRTIGELPLVLGHEVSGVVSETGPGAEEWSGLQVLVPAVIPCGECDLCRAGRGNACARQVMPGNAIDGGFASHLTVPAGYLTPIPTLPAGHVLADFAVIADAVTTPLQAVRRAGVSEGDLTIVIGTGGIGSYAVQIAAAAGALVIAVDLDPARLEPLVGRGAAATIPAGGMSSRDIKDRVRQIAEEWGAPRHGWKIFECSGHPAGQETAFGLLTTAATLAVVGFTREKVALRLSNLMAFDADAFGTWGCPPHLYPEAIELVASGRVEVLPFTRKMPMEDVETALAEAHSNTDPRRIILVP